MKIKLSIYAFCIITLMACSETNQLDSINYSTNEKSLYNSTDNNGEYETEEYIDYGENPFISAAIQPISTFGIDADGGSYSNMRRFSNYGLKPPKESVRIEEFINYFNYNYSEPTSGQVSISTELGECPWEESHQLLKIGLKGKSLDPEQIPPSNFVLLIDVSGSMSNPEKLPLLKSGFIKFVDEMKDQDKIAIVTYAGSAGVLLNSTHGDEKEKIKNAIWKLGAGGSTAGAEGIVTAYSIAEQNFIPGGNNRIILGTDGDFNVGISSIEELVSLIEDKRESGVFLSVLGVGSGNLRDGMMEQLANNGNGTYEYIDNAKQLLKVFIYEKSKFYTVAKDCKIQITFDSTRISKYRLIGYENRVLENDDFENDTVDAGEIGAGQTITAFYELIPKEGAISTPGELSFRYKFPDSEESLLMEVPFDSTIDTFDNTTEDFRFAASVVGLGLILKESEYKGNVSTSLVKSWAQNAISYDPFGFKSEFLEILNNY